MASMPMPVMTSVNKRYPAGARQGRGLAIDPTLFTRFGVEAVPVYAVLAEPSTKSREQGLW